MYKNNNQHSLLQLKKRNINQSPTETPRTLLDKVITEKNQRHSSTYMLFDQMSTRSSNKTKFSSKNSGSSKYISGLSSAYNGLEENVTPDFLLISNDKSRTKVNKNEVARTKRDFYFSRHKDAHSISSELKRKASVNETEEIAHINKKQKNQKLSENTVKSKKINDYFVADNEYITGKDKSNVDRKKTSNSYCRKKTDKEVSVFNSKNHEKSVEEVSPLINIKKTPVFKKTNVSKNNFDGKVQNTFQTNNQRSLSFNTHVNYEKGLILNSNKKVSHAASSSNAFLKNNVRADVDDHAKHGQKKTVKKGKSKIMDSACIPKKMSHLNSKKNKKLSNDCQSLSKPNNLIDQIIGSPEKHSKKLHSTAIGNTVQSFHLTESPVTSQTSSNIKHNCIDVCNVFSPLNDNKTTNMPNLQSNEVIDLISSTHDSQIPRVPNDITRNILQHFSEMPIPNNTLSVINVCCDDFWEQTLNTLDAYAKHAGRESITVDDIELLLYRQGYVKDRNSINALISKHLPLEMCLEILPIANANNNI